MKGQETNMPYKTNVNIFCISEDDQRTCTEQIWL